ncbi:LysR family transcriptional regulator [Acinetobacter equi]|uniref:LysR family transcriptional regulator n=1 Tax=Acinetobacter equi TaxID=1324350 RepID=A0A0N9W200_9GAMM|nr:LysR family transcriptional regulator [Acinetobacter equi]ALH96728.1 LysR family transcriptional regulator [Acinetobacter equi]
MNMPFSRFTEYFIAVAKFGSLRKAADHLFISVSAIHRQISLAEEEFGLPLFERFSHGLKLTLAGEMLYADLLKWQKEFQHTCIRFDEIQGLKRGNIEFGLISALNESFVTRSIQSMYNDYPWINFNIQIMDSDRISEKIIATELDFGLILNPTMHHQLEILDFIEFPIGFVMHKQHDLAKKEKIYLSDTLEERHLIPSEPLIIHDYVTALYKKHQFNPIRKTESNSIQFIHTMLKENLGISILSYLDVMPLIDEKNLYFRPILDQGLHPLTLGLCVAPKRQLSKASLQMIKHITEIMEQIKLQLHF